MCAATIVLTWKVREPHRACGGATPFELTVRRAAYLVVVTGLVPVTPLRMALCLPERDGRDIRAFTPVFDGHARP
jgi:hypothetical protein